MKWLFMCDVWMYLNNLFCWENAALSSYVSGMTVARRVLLKPIFPWFAPWGNFGCAGPARLSKRACSRKGVWPPSYKCTDRRQCPPVTAPRRPVLLVLYYKDPKLPLILFFSISVLILNKSTMGMCRIVLLQKLVTTAVFSSPP